MKITFLGSGGAFTDYRVNYHNNALVETDAGLVLLDCGFTACQSMRELGIHPSKIHTVLFTHLHGDHASPEQPAVSEAIGEVPAPRLGYGRLGVVPQSAALAWLSK